MNMPLWCNSGRKQSSLLATLANKKSLVGIFYFEPMPRIGHESLSILFRLRLLIYQVFFTTSQLSQGDMFPTFNSGREQSSLLSALAPTKKTR